MATQANPIAKPKRKSLKPSVVQAAIIARTALGDSKTQIANDLGIARNTVYSVLNSSEIEQEQLIGRSRCIRLIPTSVDVIERRLAKDSETAALAILRGTNVLQTQALTANQTNVQANVYLSMKASKRAEDAQVITVEATDTTSSSVSDPATPPK